jgi:hypothetical protein
MSVDEQILNELKQINITLSKLVYILDHKSSNTQTHGQPTKDQFMIDIEERIRKARSEAEAKMNKLKAGTLGL